MWIAVSLVGQFSAADTVDLEYNMTDTAEFIVDDGKLRIKDDGKVTFEQDLTFEGGE